MMDVVSGTSTVGVPGVRAIGYRVHELPPAVHLGLPSPWLTLIVPIEQPVRAALSLSELPDAPPLDVLVGGLGVQPAYISQASARTDIQVSVHPLAARMVFGAPAGQLPPLLDGAHVGLPLALAEEMHDLHDWAARFEALGAALRSRTRWSAPRPEVAEAWRWLARRSGRGTIADLAAHVQLSTRQLSNLFEAELGLSPKQVARLMRFDALVHSAALRIQAGARPDWADLAYTHGYADQPHLITEFRALTGTTPGAWAVAERWNLLSGAKSAMARSVSQHPQQQHATAR